MLGENIKAYRVSAGMSQGELAKRINEILGTNYKYENVKSWERGTNPKLDVISAIASIFDITEQDLFDPKKRERITRDELKTRPEHYRDALGDTLPENVVKVPLLSNYVGAGGFGTEEGHEVVGTVFVDLLALDKRCRSEKIMGVRVIGDSMEPYVKQGDIVLFVPYDAAEHGYVDGRYVIRTPMGEQVKNIKFLTDGTVRIISENPKYHGPEGYDEQIGQESQETLEIVGVVVGRIMRW